MTILEVIRECVVALFKDEILEATLVLKGGTALHLVEHIDYRLSTDVDFSAVKTIDSPKEYFDRVERALREHFATFGYEVFDANPGVRKTVQEPGGQTTQCTGARWRLLIQDSDRDQRA